VKVSTPGPAVGPSRTRPAVLAAELRISLMRASRRLRAEKADADLSDAQYSLLAYLDKHGPSTPRALAEFERVRPPSLTRTLQSVVELGLAEREAHPDDGRQVLVSLTRKGQESVRETRRRRDAWLARRLADLEPGERETLAEAAVLLRRISDT
jgi:DNA-binding MarR family transcriptional regulator